ncbi:recombination mediator RecR [Algiphilus sp.]|uniref:recombination mediator RecR n=1 Tax=Algiphilus sp. TaxID=1872431 RepID=UPI0025C551EA|nr:recombination mediator RecR [Algiphilus sp.]MCK5771886.1 recombination protein RecR [Algiphilus sp.]
MSDAFPPPLARLVEALKRLPGVGAKSAQRMALHLLDRDREGARFLVESIGGALDDLTRCPTCRMYRAAEHCRYCSDERSRAGQLCVIESPADLLAIEQHTDYRGRYFVLLGRLSPLEGTGPDELGLDQFAELLRSDWVREVILATNPTVEGETTAYYLSEMARAAGIPITRLAHGLPVGGELEYQDRGTLSHAFSGRRAFEE